MKDKKLMTKVSPQISDKVDMARFPTNRFFPPQEELSFDNYIVGFKHCEGTKWGFNVIMSQGEDSSYKLVCDANYFKEVRIPRDASVGKVRVFGTDSETAEFSGLEIFDHDGSSLIKLGSLQGKCVSLDLEKG